MFCGAVNGTCGGVYLFGGKFEKLGYMLLLYIKIEATQSKLVKSETVEHRWLEKRGCKYLMWYSKGKPSG